MPFFENVHNLLNQEITAENESKEMTVLVRVLSIIDIIVDLSCAAVFPSRGLKVVLFFLFFAAANICILIATYHVRSTVTTSLHCLALCCFVIIISLFYEDNRIGLRFSLFTLIPLVYYRVDVKRWLKAAISLVCCALSCALAVIGIVRGPRIFLPEKPLIAAMFMTIVTVTIKLVIISLYYYRKFAAGESKIVAYSKKLEQLAGADALTGLSNRRRMQDHLSIMAEKYPTQNQPFSIAICDIDFFKMVNDTYGHDAGDYILTSLATIFKEFMAGKGTPARWGGEEFLLVFDRMNGDDVFAELSRLKSQIEKTEFQYKTNTIHITMTFGLEEYDFYAGIKETIARADEKLYQGKNQGRNCVVY